MSCPGEILSHTRQSGYSQVRKQVLVVRSGADELMHEVPSTRSVGEEVGSLEPSVHDKGRLNSSQQL